MGNELKLNEIIITFFTITAITGWGAAISAKFFGRKLAVETAAWRVILQFICLVVVSQPLGFFAYMMSLICLSFYIDGGANMQNSLVSIMLLSLIGSVLSIFFIVLDEIRKARNIGLDSG